MPYQFTKCSKPNFSFSFFLFNKMLFSHALSLLCDYHLDMNFSGQCIIISQFYYRCRFILVMFLIYQDSYFLMYSFHIGV